MTVIRMLRVAALAVPLALAACAGTEVTFELPAGATLALQSGDGQSGPAGAALASPLAVVVRDAVGAPLAGVPVNWSVTSGGGTLTPGGVTGADGVAMATYTAGTTAGPKVLTAGVSGLAVVFSVTIVPGAASRMQKSGGDNQSVLAGSALPAPLSVTVTDQYGNPVQGIVVTWVVSSGGATAVPGQRATDSLGVSYTTVTTAGGHSNMIVVTASAPGLTGSPATFTASAVLITLVKSIPVPANYGIHDQFIRNGIAFVCNWNSGMQIYDVGNGVNGGTPANPVLISTIVTSANGVPGGAQMHNAWWYWSPGGQKRYVFVGQEGPGSIGTNSSGDIHVVDVSNLASPVEVAFYHMGNVNGSSAGTHNFWVDEVNEVLYAAYYNGGVVALDVAGTLSGDLAGREIARIRPGGDTNTYVWGVHYLNGDVYATDMLSGFWQLRLTGNTFSVVGGGNNVPERFGSDQWVHGGYAYSGTWGSRSGHLGNALKIWRLGAGGAPVLADSIITPNITTVSDVEVSADGTLLMFSAEGGAGSGIYFYSLADPAHPAQVGYYPVSTGVHTATFATIGARRYVFAAKDPGSPALLILDVTGLSP